MRPSFYRLLFWIFISMTLSFSSVQLAVAQITQQGSRIEGVSQAEIVQWQFRYGGAPAVCFPPPPPAYFGPEEMQPVCPPTRGKKRHRRR
jgi:hypothetical protein